MVSFKVGDEYRAFFNTWKAALETESQAKLADLLFKNTRLAIGLGSEHPYEVGCTLHRTYGVPYIPGSALKGLAAFFARQELEDWDSGSDAYKTLFGKGEVDGQAGCVTFFDALPKPIPGKGYLRRDVLTVHHPDYYQSDRVEKPPADWDSPNPIPFVTASADFVVAVSGPGEWVDAALEILKMALEEYGVGGKTSQGYGRGELKIAPATATTATASGAAGSKAGSAIEKLLTDLATAKVDKGSFQSTWVKRLDGLEGEDKQAYGKALLERISKQGWDKDWGSGKQAKDWYLKLKAEYSAG
jgi:CRISPR-associated protein Cmr6